MARKKKNDAQAPETPKSNRLPNNPGAGKVYVFCGIPQGLIFRLGDTNHLFSGVNSSKLVAANGEDLAHGKFGITPCDEATWKEIERLYGELAVFKSGLIFASETVTDGDDEAMDKQDIQTGVEQKDPNAPDLTTEPNDNNQ